MKLAIFDLDETLICGDSDNAWHDILIDNDLVDKIAHKEKKQYYYQQYLDYVLDIKEYLGFSMGYLAGKRPIELEAIRNKIVEYIAPLVWEHTLGIITAHKNCNHKCIILTTTNAFISQPIADYLDVELVATQPETINGAYTGKPLMPIVEGKTKLDVMLDYIEENCDTDPETVLNNSYFYTDSYNDIGLLRAVKYPIVVNADDKLAQIATQKKWTNISHKISAKDLANFINTKIMTNVK